MSTYTPEQLIARAEHIERQMVTWKGNPAYVETLRMEAWALRTAAARPISKEVSAS